MSANDNPNAGGGDISASYIVSMYKRFKTAQRLCASPEEFEAFLSFLKAVVTPTFPPGNAASDEQSEPDRGGPELMTYEETADLLRMSVEALRGHVHRKNIPAEAIRQIGNRVLFHRPTLLGQVENDPKEATAEDDADADLEKRRSADLHPKTTASPSRRRPSTRRRQSTPKQSDIDWSAQVDAVLADE